MPTYRAGCHCGRIRFEVEGTLERVHTCNCSICNKTGYLHWNVEPAQIRMLAGDGEWTSYRFLTGVADNRFCPTCGISPFRIPRSDPNLIDVNARCIEDLDIATLQIEPFDGQNWEAALQARNENQRPH
jgi:hypothetical protein